jgi:hypothetical protein
MGGSNQEEGTHKTTLIEVKIVYSNEETDLEEAKQKVETMMNNSGFRRAGEPLLSANLCTVYYELPQRETRTDFFETKLNGLSEQAHRYRFEVNLVPDSKLPPQGQGTRLNRTERQSPFVRVAGRLCRRESNRD